MSRVKLNLNLGLKEMYNVSNITKCIKEEIEESCGPKVITDGTRPFAVYWSDIVKKDITITVECHVSPHVSIIFDELVDVYFPICIL